MEMGQRELQERREMFRREFTNKSCQSNRRFCKDPDGSRQRLRELWEARAREQGREEGELQERRVVLAQVKHDSGRIVHKAKQRSQVLIFSDSESGTEAEADGEKEAGESGSKTGPTIPSSSLLVYCQITEHF